MPQNPIPRHNLSRDRLLAALTAVALLASSTRLASEPTVVSTASYPGIPFGDTTHPAEPQVIPGRLQNEFFDTLPVSDAEKTAGACEGVTYHDTDNKNDGSGTFNGTGSYLKEFRRFESPDISYTKFENSGNLIDDSAYNRTKPDRDALYLGWIAPGEWVKYTVDVKTAGDYTITVRYTSKFGGRIALESDGVEVTAPLAIPATSDPSDTIEWRKAHHWDTAVQLGRFPLKKGRQVLTLRFLDRPVMNFDYMDFTLVE